MDDLKGCSLTWITNTVLKNRCRKWTGRSTSCRTGMTCSTETSTSQRIDSHRRIRGCADRSWSAVRSAFPSVAHPAFSNQPPHDDHHLRERYPEIDHPPYPLRTPHQFLMRVMPRVRPLRHPTLP